MPHLTGLETNRRAVELSSIREEAFKIWQKDNTLMPTQIVQKLIELGFQQVSRSTVGGWRYRWIRGGGLARGLKTAPAKQVKPYQPTWEDIISAVPDRATLAFLVLDGFIQRIGEIEQLKQLLSTVTQERNELARQNEELRKELGHFTLDETKGILVPKK